MPNETGSIAGIFSNLFKLLDTKFEREFEKALEKEGFRNALSTEPLKAAFRLVAENNEAFYTPYFNDAQDGKGQDHFKVKLQADKTFKTALTQVHKAGPGKDKTVHRPTVNQERRREEENITHIMVGYSPADDIEKSLAAFENSRPALIIGRDGSGTLSKRSW